MERRDVCVLNEYVDEVTQGGETDGLCAGLRVSPLAAFPGSSTNLYSGRRTKGWGRPGSAEPGWSGPGAEEQAYDSLLYPLAIGGHFIQSALHADAHVLNGIELVHEALSLRVLQQDR